MNFTARLQRLEAALTPEHPLHLLSDDELAQRLAAALIGSGDKPPHPETRTQAEQVLQALDPVRWQTYRCATGQQSDG